LNRKARGEISVFGRERLTLDLARASTAAIAEAVEKLPLSARAQLLSKIDLLLRGAAGKSEAERVAAAKLFVAMLPDSLEKIQKWLQKRSERWHYEVHFSLFCFLDDSLSLPLDAKVLSSIEGLVVRYLKAAKSDTAHAVWMAADLLGHHWPGRAALDALISVAKQGRHAEGRKAALSGLQRRLEDHDQGGRAEIIETLKKVASTDASPLIRRKAERLLNKVEQ
jgi:hypothetical protein